MYSIARLDITEPGVAERVVELQRSAYAVEAELIGFDGIPPLHESASDVISLSIEWVGAFEDGTLVGGIGYRDRATERDIDRLFVDPALARRGIGRALVNAVLGVARVTVSTGTANPPALALYESLGFQRQGITEIAPGITVTSLLYNS